MLLATTMQQILSKSAQNCPKPILWNTTKNRNFSFFQKNKILCIEEALEHVSTVWIFNSRIFHMLFFKKQPLYMNFSIPPCGNWWFSQGSTPCVGMRFCGHLPNSPRNKNQKGIFHFYLRKWFFWTPKDCCLLLAWAKKLFLQLRMLWSRKW
jgi:hypothetical protein